MAGGMASDTPAAAVQWGTYPHQRTVSATISTLDDAIRREGLEAPVITVIGPVVALRESIAWFDSRPLFGKRIIVTRARSQATSLTDQLTAAGAHVIEMPATQIEPTDASVLSGVVTQLSQYGWIVFTSQNAVRIFWDALREQSLDARALAGVKIAAVGPATSGALLDRGLAVDVAPDRFVAEALLDALRDRRDVRGVRVLYAAAEGAREVLQLGLEELGAVVDRVELYRSVRDGEGAERLRALLLDGQADLVTFTSASSVNAFVEAVGDEASRCAPAATIGPITANEARARGIDVVIEAEESTIGGLVDAIRQHFTLSQAPT
jgi:uroporphyrinogen III methyltransferase / synthase